MQEYYETSGNRSGHLKEELFEAQITLPDDLLVLLAAAEIGAR